MTMVMVTHDVNLKLFADRVFWLRDGRLQRVEEIPPEKKAEVIRKFDEELDQLKRRIPRTMHGTITEFRKPNNYKFHPNYDPQIKGKYKMQFFLSLLMMLCFSPLCSCRTEKAFIAKAERRARRECREKRSEWRTLYLNRS
jgi:ABC-type proline/glycine betaine transport system ATPase subunit